MSATPRPETGSTRPRKSIVAPPRLRVLLRSLLESEGPRRVEQRIGLSRNTLFRCLAAVPCHPATVALISRELERQPPEARP